MYVFLEKKYGLKKLVI
jgi:Ca2+-binding EF-hand superfamily protein